jgi:arsenate reductase
MLTVYGIKSCDTCRRARKFLEDRNIEFRFHDLREDGLDIQMLERWSARIDWERLLNFFAVGFSEKRFTDFLEKTA